MKNIRRKEQIFSGLTIRAHEIRDAKSKVLASKSLSGWTQVSQTAHDWIKELEAGRTIQPSVFSPKADGTFTHAKEHWHGTHFVCCDADNIKGIEFTDTGEDKSPDGVDAWTEKRKLSQLYPTLKDKVYAVGESVSSMSEDKSPPHRRYRLIFVFDTPITDKKHYHQILLAFAKEFSIIPSAERSPAQPVFGNAREGFGFHICGNILNLSDFPFSPEIISAPEQTQTEFSDKNDTPNESLSEFLDRHGISYTQADVPNKYYVVCPNQVYHTDAICKPKDAYVFDDGSGTGWGFYCSHTSCSQKRHWATFREGVGIPKKEWVDRRVKTPMKSPTEDSDLYRGKQVVCLQEEFDEEMIETKLRDEVSDEVLRILKQADTLVTHGGNLGVFRESESSVTFEIVKSDGALGIISRNVAVRETKRRASNLNGETQYYLTHNYLPQAPKWLADDILNNQVYSGIPVFRGVVRHPYLFEGKIIDDTGFNKTTGFMREPTSVVDLVRPASKEDCIALLRDELLCDFPFSSEADFENALSIALTLFVRTDFESSEMPPLFAINAASPGTGKSELAMALTTILLGESPAVSAIPDSKEEIRKALFSNLLEGKQYCIFDNVDPNQPIDSGMLASIVSQPKHTGRILGANKTANLENRMSCIYTGNNIQATPELVDRGILIQLESPAQRSHERDFKHLNLSSHIISHRGEYLGALAFMIENWIKEERPRSEHRHRMRHWAGTIGGILEVNGLGKHFLSNNKQFRVQADSESPQIARAFSAIYAQLGEKPWTIEDIFTIISYKQHYYHNGAHYPAEGENLLGDFITGRDDQGRARSAGVAMKKRIGQTLNGFKLETAGTFRNRNLFKLVQVRTDF